VSMACKDSCSDHQQDRDGHIVSAGQSRRQNDCGAPTERNSRDEASKQHPQQMVLGNLIFQAEVVEQRLRAIVLPHHDQQASDDQNQTERMQVGFSRSMLEGSLYQ
jgi:hypothetical protein